MRYGVGRRIRYVIGGGKFDFIRAGVENCFSRAADGNGEVGDFRLGLRYLDGGLRLIRFAVIHFGGCAEVNRVILIGFYHNEFYVVLRRYLVVSIVVDRLNRVCPYCKRLSVRSGDFAVCNGCHFGFARVELVCQGIDVVGVGRALGGRNDSEIHIALHQVGGLSDYYICLESGNFIRFRFAREGYVVVTIGVRGFYVILTDIPYFGCSKGKFDIEDAYCFVIRRFGTFRK